MLVPKMHRLGRVVVRARVLRAPAESRMIGTAAAGVAASHGGLHARRGNEHSAWGRCTSYFAASAVAAASGWLLSRSLELSSHPAQCHDEQVEAEIPEVSPDLLANKKAYRVENGTDIEYPYVRDDDGTSVLLGAGWRTMTPMKVRVYTIGVYADRDAMEKDEVLKEYLGAKSTEEFMSGDCDAFWARFLDPSCDVEVSIRMIVFRPVDGKHMQNGFDRALIPRVRDAAKNRDMPNGKAGLKKLNGCFLKKKLMKEGTQIEFVRHPGGKLSVFIDGLVYAEIENRALVWALMDMFLGAQAVAPEVKLHVCETLSAQLPQTS
ncbi:Fatty-acid-binding protein 3, chloroplastic [Porphyridium purpureum]|uniref:Fatty-acid-binding protein 3, chloroplastic n=1 Tax=Porphyridium purpureum TaxID=35688 RepID=A0A5J4YKI6_PORPP|nr:Fatty-acid-binding protein 3, chloroplastic [Porphyridium purpureum]|eukprot:POR7329..scf244_11